MYTWRTMSGDVEKSPLAEPDKPDEIEFISVVDGRDGKPIGRTMQGKVVFLPKDTEPVGRYFFAVITQREKKFIRAERLISARSVDPFNEKEDTIRNAGFRIGGFTTGRRGGREKFTDAPKPIAYVVQDGKKEEGLYTIEQIERYKSYASSDEWWLRVGREVEEVPPTQGGE